MSVKSRAIHWAAAKNLVEEKSGEELKKKNVFFLLNIYMIVTVENEN